MFPTSSISGLQAVIQSCRLSPSSTLDSSVHLTRALGTVARAEPVPCREETLENTWILRVI